MASHDQKGHVALYLNILNLRDAMKPLLTLPSSWDAAASAYGITWPKGDVAPHFNYPDLMNAMVPLMMLMPEPMASCDQKSYTAPHCTCLNLTMVLFMILLASFDATLVPNGITWPKSDVAHHFDYLELTSATLSWAMPSASHDANASTKCIT